MKTNGVGKSAIWETDKDTRGNGKQERQPNQVTERVCYWWSKGFVKRLPRSERPGTKGLRETPPNHWQEGREVNNSGRHYRESCLGLHNKEYKWCPGYFKRCKKPFWRGEENCEKGFSGEKKKVVWKEMVLLNASLGKFAFEKDLLRMFYLFQILAQFLSSNQPEGIPSCLLPIRLGNKCLLQWKQNVFFSLLLWVISAGLLLWRDWNICLFNFYLILHLLFESLLHE